MAIQIFIDQGHNPTGYPNTGASWYGQEEQDITYEVGVELAKLLEEDGRFAVRLSRPTPETVLGTSNATSLMRRVQMANQWPADYFISIHANASTNPKANGTEVLVYQLGTQANWLAQQVADAVSETAGTKNNGVIARPGLYVLRKTDMPSILVEMAYLSNPSDAQKLRDEPELFALGIYRGMLRYFGMT